MLRYISIDNYTLIDHLEVEFQPGLNLITGETGSGKSILVDAVSLLVGSRASQEMVREGDEVARIEGVYALHREHPVTQRLSEAGLEGEGDQLVIRREISLTGSNRIFINGRLSTLSLLVEIGGFLVDIHGQHEQQRLLQAGEHLRMLDDFGQNDGLLLELKGLYQRLIELKERVATIQQSERDRLHRKDLLRYQIDEIEGLQLRPGLDRELLEEKNLLSSAEKRSHAAQASYDLLYEREISVLTLLDRVTSLIEDLSFLDSRFREAETKLRDIYYQAEEIAFEVRDYADKIEFNPTRLEQVEERLAEIEKAKRKYGESIDSILEYAEHISEEIRELNCQENELAELAVEIQQLEQSFGDVAEDLSKKRAADSARLSELIERELEELAMQDTRFVIQLERMEERLGEKGIDVAEFLISANPGEAPRPLTKIASGGELSRVMLALKSCIKLDETPRTLIFDEVDAGIGGRVADSLGEKLSKLSTRHQVFCVTHLPQIAAYANQHFHVAKVVRKGRTAVELRSLDNEGRLQELSRMLAGDKVSKTTLRQAQELLDRTGREAFLHD